MYRTPFTDNCGPDMVPKTSSHSVDYNHSNTVPDVPGRDGGYVKEVTFDNIAKDPSVSGPYKTPYKDKVG